MILQKIYILSKTDDFSVTMYSETDICTVNIYVWSKYDVGERMVYYG